MLSSPAAQELFNAWGVRACQGAGRRPGGMLFERRCGELLRPSHESAHGSARGLAALLKNELEAQSREGEEGRSGPAVNLVESMQPKDLRSGVRGSGLSFEKLPEAQADAATGSSHAAGAAAEELLLR